VTSERLVLFRVDANWFVTYRGRPIGPFKARPTALRSAIMAAEADAAEGHDTEVVENQFDQPPWTVWRCGRDTLSL
jgi:hypothetical protein